MVPSIQSDLSGPRNASSYCIGGKDNREAAKSPVLIGCSLLLFVLAFLELDQTICRGAEPPSVEQLRESHQHLQKDAENVQGNIRVYRQEGVMRDAIENAPSDLKLPLVRSGTFWRNDARFRANYRTHDWRIGFSSETQNSVAMDRGVLYELTGGKLEIGVLRVYEKDIVTADAVRKSIDTLFLAPIDSLWKYAGMPFTDILQRPGSRIGPNESPRFSLGYAIFVTMDDGSELPYDFAPTKPYPFGYFQSPYIPESSPVTLERWVFSQEVKGRVFPNRIVDIVSSGPSTDQGFTEVTVLQLEPLDKDSPIATEISINSFRDLGFSYQAYRISATGGEELSERYEKPVESAEGFTTRFRHGFLWANGLLILVLVGYYFYTLVRKK